MNYTVKHLAHEPPNLNICACCDEWRRTLECSYTKAADRGFENRL